MQGSVAVGSATALGRAIRGATDLVRLTRPAVASGAERRAKTFWEVAAGAGLRTSVVNWWATWPAPPDAGVILSDRATLRLERAGPLDAEIAPASLYGALRQQWPDIKSRAAERAARALDGPTDDAAREVLRRSAEIDAVQLELLAQVATATTDLAVVYLPGLDIAQHALLGADPSAPNRDLPGLSAATISARLQALEAYYSALDRLLGAHLSPAPDELVVVVTEPGRVGEGGRAFFSIRGRAVQPRPDIVTPATAVAPTVLYALGVPIASDLMSPPVLEWFEPQFIARYPVRRVATYGRPSAAAIVRVGQPLDQEMIDRLRSLGYVR
jgi:hypothetical protein